MDARAVFSARDPAASAGIRRDHARAVSGAHRADRGRDARHEPRDDGTGRGRRERLRPDVLRRERQALREVEESGAICRSEP